MKKKASRVIIILLIISSIIFFSSSRNIMLAKVQGYKALKVFAEVNNKERMSDFLSYDTKHFIIKYDYKDENIVRNAARIFEESYDIVSKDFDYSPQDKMTVYIYEDQQTMWKYQKSVDGQAVMGFYSMGMIHILSPNAYEGNKLDPMDYFEKNGPILHEYTHKMVDDKTGGNIELWLTEGIALYEEYSELGIEWAPGFYYDNYISADDLRNHFIDMDEVQAYRQSFDTVKKLIDIYGRDKLMNVLDELKSGNSLDQAFEDTYHFTANEFIGSIKLNIKNVQK